MKHMDFVEYVMAVQNYASKHPEQRSGQQAFNVLYDVRPDLANAIRMTDLDPFYDNRILPDFYTYISERMS